MLYRNLSQCPEYKRTVFRIFNCSEICADVSAAQAWQNSKWYGQCNNQSRALGILWWNAYYSDSNFNHILLQLNCHAMIFVLILFCWVHRISSNLLLNFYITWFSLDLCVYNIAVPGKRHSRQQNRGETLACQIIQVWWPGLYDLLGYETWHLIGRCCRFRLYSWLTETHRNRNKYSLLMHCIKIKSPPKSLLNEQYVFVGGNISFLCVLSCSSEEA